MSAGASPSAAEAENNCVVCFKNVDIYSVGVCDHPVCFECSTRMRVLCNQFECPICRQHLPQVIFIKEVEPFNELQRRLEPQSLQDRRYQITFASPPIQRRYYRLLEHECMICKRNGCGNPFKTFQQLKEHMRRAHELFYCDLCVINLKIFTFERSFYTRSELATHRRKGDPDNTSHKGHPLCEFCETRFMDNDELFRHLRRDHLFCHFCDMDGKHQYYNTYVDLRRHYLDEHYLCEEGECKYEKFTSVFRTDIDLKAHYAAKHGKNLSKAANRQARTLEVQFTLAPRVRPDASGRARHYNSGTERHDEIEGAIGYNIEPGGPGGGVDDRLFINPLSAENFPSLSGELGTSGPRTVSNVTITSKLNPLNEQNFPSLGNSGAAPVRSSAVTITTSKFNPHSTEDFPSLGGTTSAPSRQPAVTITRTVRGHRSSANFPTLQESSGITTNSENVRVNSTAPTGGLVFSVNSNVQHPNKTQNVSIRVNHKPNGAITTSISQIADGSTVSVRPKTVEAFPALSTTEPQLQQPQWVPQKAKKQPEQPKTTKVAPAPSLPPSSLNDFPTLSKAIKGESSRGKKSSSVVLPVSNTWVNLNNFNNETKHNASTSTSSSGVPSEQKQKAEKAKQKEKEKEKENKVSSSSKSPKAISKSSKTIELSVSDSNENKSKNKKKKNKNSILMNVEETPSNSKRTSVAVDNNKNDSPKPDESPKQNKTPNGITKKRSELNIGALEVRDEPTFIEHSTVTTNKPPPGFTVKPPPGFNNFVVSNNVVSNDLTFTNSSGQSYAIVPNTETFYQPPNFHSRNHLLVEKFKTVCPDADVINQFKLYSSMFRVGDIPPEKYYQHCRDLMGDEFKTIFPELLVLLPNIERQQQLFKLYLNSDNRREMLEVCATCGQIVLRRDLRDHLSHHMLDNHFPALKQAPAENNNVWNKK